MFWISPWGARTLAPDGADSCVGLELALTRVREREALGVLGASAGAARYASSDGGRVWASALIGTRRGLGWAAGLTAGPWLELSPTARPRWGGQLGVWITLGITPFLRAATIDDRGVFAEVGLSVPLPVARWR
ncbi:MAG: hypothetical protein R3B48_01885 [Kofleriaceae bacterium]